MLYSSAVLVDRLMTLGNAARDIPAPKWLLTVSMPLGFALLTFRFVEAGWHLIRTGGDENDGDQPYTVDEKKTGSPKDKT